MSINTKEKKMLIDYAEGRISKDDAMHQLDLKKVAFNSRMRSLGYSSETHFFPGKPFKALIPKNDQAFWKNLHDEYLQGESIDKIADRLGVRKDTVRDQFIKFGFELRSKQETRNLAIKNMTNTMLQVYGVSRPQQLQHIKDKTKATVLQKYGVDNVAKSDQAREKISENVKQSAKGALVKRVQTVQKNYGVSYVAQNQNVQAKLKDTNLNKYGNKSAAASDEVRRKIQATNLERYGGTSPLSNEDVISKRISTVKQDKLEQLLKNLEVFEYELLEPYDGLFMNVADVKSYKKYKVRHKKCLTDFKDDVYLIPRCPVCFPLIGNMRSQLEILLSEYIESLGFKVVCNSREVIRNPTTGKWFELDIYIPEKKLAFEIDSLYHHSDQSLSWGKPLQKDYHQKKTLASEENGIRLIHLWDDWSVEKIKSIILCELGLLDKKSARSLQIKEINCADFFDENHVYGSARADYQYALVDKENEIWCALSLRSHSEGLEIGRFATKVNTTVRGGFSKLLKHALNSINWHTLISYCDRDLSPSAEDTVYYKKGFELIGDTGPRLFYTNFRRRWSREAFQKHKLKEMFPESFDESLTSNEILSAHGIYSIWNSGNWKFVLKKS
jgi:hypothetical protein